MAENINPSQYYTPETLRRLGNLAKGIYNYYGDERYNPDNYKTNFNDLQRATVNVRKHQELPQYSNEIPMYREVLPTKNNPQYYRNYEHFNMPYPLKRPIYFDGSFVPDLAQFYNLTKYPEVGYFGGEIPRTNKARNPQY